MGDEVGTKICVVPDGLLRVHSARLPLARSRAFCSRMGPRILVRLGAHCQDSRGFFATFPACHRALHNFAPALGPVCAVGALEEGGTGELPLINEANPQVQILAFVACGADILVQSHRADVAGCTEEEDREDGETTAETPHGV